MTSCASMVVFAGSLIGVDLAPTEKLSTLPNAVIVVGTALTSIPIALSMRKFGRRKVFVTASSVAVVVALIGAYSIMIQSFALFCATTALLGATMAAVQQFRFAAMESVPTDQAPRAASQVLLGGLAAAFIGPELALLGKDWFEAPFAGSFILLAGLFVISSIVLNNFRNIGFNDPEFKKPGRHLSNIIKQPIFWVAVTAAVVGYASMTFIMTATPISMHVHNGHSLQDTKWVIQSHIIAMFLPSLFTAFIIRMIGIIRMMLIGLILFAGCLFMAYSGFDFYNYWTSLVLLGVGWNFLFIGGTTLLPTAYEPNERFKVQALNDFLVFGSQATASLGAGWILFQFGWQQMLILTIPFMAMPLLAMAVWAMKSRSNTQPS